MRWFSALCVVGILLAFAAISGAQVTTATISGTVSDSSGAVLPNAKIEIQNEGTGASRTVMSGPDGHYSAPSLPVGNYKVTATVEGFQTQVRSGIVLTVGQEAVVDLKLSVGTVSESVEVTGEAPLVETTESTVSYLVNDKTLRDLPLNGRDMSQLILLNPGVTLSVNSSAQQGFNGYGLRIIVKLHGDTVSSDHHADYFNNPRVSYDNTKIAYEGIGGRVYVVNRSNGGVIKVFQPSTGIYATPSWSEAGKILVAGDPVQNPGLYLLSLNADSVSSVGSGLTAPKMPNFSHDGSSICFVMKASVFTMNADGSAMKQFSDTVGACRYPVWSPDKKWIATFSNNTVLLLPIGVDTTILDMRKFITDPNVSFDNTSSQISWR